jgi:hypothetical protein
MKSPSAKLPAGFRFVDNPAAWIDAGARVVRIPRGVRSKRALLAEYVDQLRLPKYFGWNWDALDECLRDLHWLPDARRVALVHEGLPLQRGARGRRTYLQLLRDAVAAWAAGDEHELIAIFPTQLREEIAHLLSDVS